jgi:hypothetical protein
VTAPAISDLTLDLDGSWGIGGKIHGGYLLSQIVGAAIGRLPGDHPHPLAVSAQFLSAPDPGPADLSVEVLRTGRSVSSLRARLGQQGQLRTEALITAGRLADGGEPVWVAPDGAPDLPPPEDCPRAPALRPDGVRIGHLEHVDLRPDPRTSGWARGRPGRVGELAAWLRPDPASGEATAPDVVWLLIAGDALPPITFNFGLLGWVPTVSFDMQVRAVPPAGWVAAVQRSRLIANNWLDETCDLYDEAGRLIGSARQLAGYRG